MNLKIEICKLQIKESHARRKWVVAHPSRAQRARMKTPANAGFPENEVRVFGGSRCGGRRRARLTGTPTALQFAAGNPYYAAKKAPIIYWGEGGGSGGRIRGVGGKLSSQVQQKICLGER